MKFIKNVFVELLLKNITIKIKHQTPKCVDVIQLKSYYC